MRTDLRREADALLAALHFLTRLPVPWPAAYDPAWLARSAKYFPLVGLIVGGLAAFVLTAADAVWAGAIPALLAVGAAVLVTGAFHEDGLADLADSAGGLDPETRLAIMKDSRLGTFGALALAFAVGAEITAVAGLPTELAGWGLVAAHAGGRALAVLVMAFEPYAGDPDRAKAPHQEGRPGLRDAAIGLAIAALPLLALGPRAAFAGLILGGVTALVLVAWSRARLGGYTGDVLGAVACAFRPAFLLGLLATVP